VTVDSFMGRATATAVSVATSTKRGNDRQHMIAIG
jgi:hypothetical protein